MDWNPHAPDFLGVEFFPTIVDPMPVYRVAAPGDAVAQRLASSIDEVIGTMNAMMQMDTATGQFVGEVFNAGGEEPEVLTTHVPVIHVLTSSSMLPNDEGSVLPILNQTSPPNPLSYITLNDSAYNSRNFGGGTMRLAFDTGGLFTGRRIIAVRMVFVVSDPTSQGIIFEGGEVSWVNPKDPSTPPFTPNAINWFPQGVGTVPFVSGPAIQEFSANTGEIRPGTGSFWSPGDLEEFAISDAIDNGMYFSLAIFGYRESSDPGAQKSPRLYQIWMEVDHAEETRVANDIVSPGNADMKWQSWTPHRPDPALSSWQARTANFEKAPSQDLTTVLRQPRYGTVWPYDAPVVPPSAAADFRFNVPYVQGDRDVPDSGVKQYGNIRLSDPGIVSTLGPVETKRVIPVAYGDGGSSPDSQAYAGAELIDINASLAVTGQGAVVQGVSNAASKMYAGVLLVLKYTGTPTGDLTYRLTRRSDGGTLATATITTADIDEAATQGDVFANGLTIVQILFGKPVLLAAGVQYNWSLTGVNPSSGGSFYTAALHSHENTVGTTMTGAGTYDGETDSADYNTNNGTGLTSWADADIPGLISALVEPPTNLTVTPNIVPL